MCKYKSIDVQIYNQIYFKLTLCIQVIVITLTIQPTVYNMLAITTNNKDTFLHDFPEILNVFASDISRKS